MALTHLERCLTELTLEILTENNVSASDKMSDEHLTVRVDPATIVINVEVETGIRS
ncbi:hypothetical protein HAX54_029991, partial [Datura stramonium]|nr:hypothetical protein [Datura stramonium]